MRTGVLPVSAHRSDWWPSTDAVPCGSGFQSGAGGQTASWENDGKKGEQLGDHRQNSTTLILFVELRHGQHMVLAINQYGLIDDISIFHDIPINSLVMSYKDSRYEMTN